MFQSKADEMRSSFSFCCRKIFKIYWGKGKIKQWDFLQRKTGLLAATALGVFLGNLTGCRAAEWPPSSCSGQNPQGLCVITALSEANTAWDSLSASGWQEVSLAALKAAASRLHYGCREPPEPTQQPPGPGKTFRPPKPQLRALRDSLLWGRKSENSRVPSCSTGCSARPTQPAEFRDQMSLQTHLTGTNRALSKGRNMSNSFPAFFWEKSLTCIRKESVCRGIIFFSTTSVSKGAQPLHCFTVHVFAQRQMYEMHYAEAMRFLTWVCPGHAIHTSHTRRHQFTLSQRPCVP